MVKWGIRSLGTSSAASRYRDQGKTGRGKSNTTTSSRGYREEQEYSDDSDDDSYSQQSSVINEEEEEAHQEGRDDGEYREEAEERYDDDEEEEEEEDEEDEQRERPSYGKDRQRELVTRDQVLSELRAQAAADALGKSLEQMGYNLDNCDSFYSLSDKEVEDGVDQRYMIIRNQPSNVSGAGGGGDRQASAKKRRSKSKKKKHKSSAGQSRYTVASEDEEEESTEYGRRGFGDYETYAESMTEISMEDDDSSSEEDEASFTTGMTSRFSRFTGKKSGKFRKHLKSNKKPRHNKGGRGGIGDNETYYTRGTEWTAADSSYAKTIDESSTISSVSSLEGSDTETAYTEPSRRGGRRRTNNKADPNNKRRSGAGGRAMRAIEEEDFMAEDSWERAHNRKRRGASAKISERAAAILKRNESGNFSSSSQIGAMRSIDSSIVDDEGAKEESDEIASTGTGPKQLERKKQEKKKNEKGADKKKKKKSSNKSTISVSSGDHDKEEAPQQTPRKSHKGRSGEAESSDDDSVTNKMTEAMERSNKSRRDKAAETEKEGKKKRGEKGAEKYLDAKEANKREGQEKVEAKKIRGGKGAKKEGSTEAKKAQEKEIPAAILPPQKETPSSPKAASFWPMQFLSLRTKKKTMELSQDSVSAKAENNAKDKKKDADSTVGEQSANGVTSSQLDGAASTHSRESSRQQSAKHESRARSKSPTKHKKSGSRANDDSDMPVLQELLKSQDSGTVVEKEGNNTPISEPAPPAQTSTSIGLLEVAAMAAMLPLVPLAAVYSCYTAEGTQSLIKVANCADTACNTAVSPTDLDDDDHTRSSRKKRSFKKHDDSTVKTSERSLKSSRSKRSHRSTRTSERSVKSISSKKGALVESKVASPLDTTSGGAASPTKPSTARIQEESEGFESFLPGSLEGLPVSATTTSHALSSNLPPTKKQLRSSKRGSGQPSKNKKSKRWISKLGFGSKKKENTTSDDRVVYLVELPKTIEDRSAEPPVSSVKPNPEPPQPPASSGMPPQPPASSRKAPQRFNARVPSRLPFMKRKQSISADSTKALNSFWAETPTIARQVIIEDETPKSRAPQGNFGLFSCSTKAPTATALGNNLREDNNDLDIENALLDDFESIAFDVTSKKHAKRTKGGAEFDPATATQEDLLKYYDLGQTISDVNDARQTLEQAYGVASGGGSFDHTIDEQLVELLTHMAEMDQDDVVEIEAAIKKLKRHARKLGISEKDLLFSVKSAEEGVESLACDDEVSEAVAPTPPAFGEKMLGVFGGYFGGK